MPERPIMKFAPIAARREAGTELVLVRRADAHARKPNMCG